jgi:hypothetical protein
MENNGDVVEIDIVVAVWVITIVFATANGEEET